MLILQYKSRPAHSEDIPETIVKKKKELEMHREDLLSKPENIRERNAEGRISKKLGELALLEQLFIKDECFSEEIGEANFSLLLERT